MDDHKQLRDHLLELLDGKSAHIDAASALDGFPLQHINTRIENSPHTPWELLEHLRLAQRDIIDFSTNPDYEEMSWPDDYWPKEEASEEGWRRSVEEILSGLAKMREMVADPDADLFKPFEHGQGQTLLREAMLVADHNAYHIGQLMLLRRVLEK